MRKLFLLVLMLICNNAVFSQIVPDAITKFSNVYYYQVTKDKKEEPLVKLISSELANSEAKISTSTDGRITYFTFYSSIFGGESVLIIQSATKAIEDDTVVYTAKCKSLMHDTESTWMLYYKGKELIQACNYFPDGKLWIIKFK